MNTSPMRSFSHEMASTNSEQDGIRYLDMNFSICARVHSESSRDLSVSVRLRLSSECSMAFSISEETM